MKRVIIAIFALFVSIAAAAQSKTLAYEMGSICGSDSSKVSGRALTKRLVMPKGAFGVSLQGNISKFSASDLQALALMTGFNGGLSYARIAPAFTWAHSDNNALGLRLAYSRMNLNIDSGTVRLFTDELKFDLSGTNTNLDSFAAEAFHKSWFGLDERGRFSLFAELALGYAYSNVSASKGSKACSHKLGLVFSPGLEVFVTNKLSLFFSLNFGQLSYNMAKSYNLGSEGKDWEQTGSSNSFKAQARVNVTDLNLGLALYF